MVNHTEEERFFLSHDGSTDAEDDLPPLHKGGDSRSMRRSRFWPFSLNHYFVRRRLRKILRGSSTILLLVKVVLLTIVGLLVITPIVTSTYRTPPARYVALARRCAVEENRGGCANLFNEKIFISVSLYDNTGELAAGEWGQRLLQLIDLIGDNNVFVSIYENDSGAKGRQALRSLQSQLKSRNRIVIEDHVPLDGFPTIRMPDGSDRVKRLAYLSEMRNRALRPLDEMNAVELGTARFDKILFLNDVLFRPIDAANLLFSTNVISSSDPRLDGRTDYLATCGLDFNNPFELYDVYAQRDAEGFSNGLALFPFFSNAGQGISRAAMLRGTDAVPVKSCWGGMAAMRADVFQGQAKKHALAHDSITTKFIDPVRPQNVSVPVRFRFEPEVFFDACECCLLMADAARVAQDQGLVNTGIYVNQFVRNAYSIKVLDRLQWVQKWERLLVIPQWLITNIGRLPTHNPHRQVRQGDAFKEEVWINDAETGAGHWEMMDRVGRNGMFCVVRELQIIKPGDRGSGLNWENVAMPPGQTLYFPT